MFFVKSVVCLYYVGDGKFWVGVWMVKRECKLCLNGVLDFDI